MSEKLTELKSLLEPVSSGDEFSKAEDSFCVFSGRMACFSKEFFRQLFHSSLKS